MSRDVSHIAWQSTPPSTGLAARISHLRGLTAFKEPFTKVNFKDDATTNMVTVSSAEMFQVSVSP